MTIEKIAKSNNLDAMLFFSPENRFWLTDFHSSLGYLFLSNREIIFLWMDVTLL
jgi:hypothetical protein